MAACLRPREVAGPIHDTRRPRKQATSACFRLREILSQGELGNQFWWWWVPMAATAVVAAAERELGEMMVHTA
jgi:hypothetical protein